MEKRLCLSMPVSFVSDVEMRTWKSYDAKWKPRAHDVVLHSVCDGDWHAPSDWIHNLGHKPVEMEENDGAKGKWKASDFQDGQLAVVPAKGHARQ